MPLGQQTPSSPSSPSLTPASDQMRTFQENRSRTPLVLSVNEHIHEFWHNCKQEASATKASWKKGKYFTAIAGGAYKILGLCIIGPVYVVLIAISKIGAALRMS